MSEGILVLFAEASSNAKLLKKKKNLLGVAGVANAGLVFNQKLP